MEIEISKPHLEKHCCDPKITIVDSNTSYNDFFETYLQNNDCCLIQNVSNNWESATKWVKNELPNFAYLGEKFGKTSVSVHNCNLDYDYNSKPTTMKFKDYLNYWENYIKNGYSTENPVLYLKDWHLMNTFSINNFYEVPLYFSSDWLNEYLIENSLDDFRFVYMGPKGTWSPLHVDVMTSFSWSTNICGQKKWVLFPPGEEDLFRDHLGNFPSDINDSYYKYKHFEVIQNSGEAIFVPSNWYHQVWNTKDTISINQNWINGCNIKSVWNSMERNLVDVKKEIEDCADMENFLDHCQIMLKASFNMNFEEFYNLVTYIARKRIELCLTNKTITLFNNRILGRNHAIFDLHSIKTVVELLNNYEDIQNLTYFKSLKVTPSSLLQEINELL